MRWKKVVKRETRRTCESLLIWKHNKFLITSFGKLIWWHYSSHSSLESWSLSRLPLHTIWIESKKYGKSERKLCFYVSEEMEIYLSEKLDGGKSCAKQLLCGKWGKFMFVEVSYVLMLRSERLHDEKLLLRRKTNQLCALEIFWFDEVFIVIEWIQGWSWIGI